MSAFRIAILRKDGAEVRLKPGSVGERDFVQAIATAIAEATLAERAAFVDNVVAGAVAEGVGLLRTEAQARKAIETGLYNAMRKVPIHATIERGIVDTFRALKSEVEPST